MPEACSQAVILAGGLGTRIRPVTEKIPKSLVEVEGRPFIFYQLDLLIKNRVNQVILLLGYMGEMVEEVIRQSEYHSKMSFSFAYDGPDLLGTAGSVRKAIHLMADNFFLLYGDSYLDCDYQAVYSKFSEQGRLALMTVLKNNNQWDRSNVVLDGDEILLYSKNEVTKDMNYIDYGLSIFNKNAFLRYVPESKKYDLFNLFTELLQLKQLSSYEVSTRFYEIGSFAGIRDLEAHIRA